MPKKTPEDSEIDDDSALDYINEDGDWMDEEELDDLE